MTPRFSHWWGWCRASVAVALASWAFQAAFVFADEPPVAYRRILVPADSPSTWPREGKAFLPVESREFDAWVVAANQPPSTATVTEASYEARLLNNELVDGRGRWQVKLRGVRPARIAIGATSLTLSDSQWQGDSNPPARLGWWPGDDGQTLVYALEVPRTGELEFNWRTKAVATSAGDAEFPLQLPIAAHTQLILDVPAGKRPVLEGGAVLESPARPEDGGRWVLSIRPAAATVLRFENTTPAAAPSTFTTAVHEELRYDVSKRGVELQATLRLAATGTAVKELTVSLPPGWQLVEAAAGERSLSWRVAPPEKAGGPTRATIQLPAFESGETKTVMLRAWGPFVVGESQRLPMLAIDNVFWTSGTIELALDDSLELRELAPIDCIQTAAEPDPAASEPGRHVRFAAFSPAAAVEVALAYRASVGLVRMGTTLEIGNSGVAARLVADVSVDRGSLHKLSADLQTGWSIDAVETVPAGALGEWYVDSTRNPQTLVVQLTRAVTQSQSVRVVVTGRRERASTLDPLSLANVNPLTWRDLSADRTLIQLRAAEQFELETVGELPGITAASLTAAERELFSNPTAGRLCDLAASAPNAAIRLAPKKGAYDATIQLDADMSQGRLQQTYRIECRPQGGGIDHVLVYLSEATSEPLHWTLADSHEPLVTERMPANDPRLRGLPAGGELWLLHLRRLYARPVALTANWSTPWPDRRRVPLVSLPDAAEQQGRVMISSAGAELPTIVAQGMSPTPLPVGSLTGAPSDSALAVRAVYRFQPTRLYDAGAAAQLWLGPATAGSEDMKLLATRVDVESRFSADGVGVHHVTYRLENRGTNAITLTLPENVSLDSARIDGQLVSSSRRDKFAVPLSAWRPTSDLELVLSSRGPRLASGSQLPAPVPLGGLTILQGRWNVSVPQGFAAIGSEVLPTGAAIGWRERLFGPLARPQSERVFNPLVGGDWNKLWAQLSQTFSTPAEAAARPMIEKQMGLAGWDSFQVDFFAGPPAAITLTHRPATTALALAVFLVCAVGVVLCGVRGLTLVLLAAGAAAISLFLSAMVAPLATAATLGFLAAALGRWWQRTIDHRRSVAASLAFMLILSTASAHAAPPAAGVERVLVPIDAEGQTVGTKYFVDADFLRELIGSTDQQSATGGWLLTDMSVDGELVPRQEQAGLGAGVWQLTFEVDVLARDTTIHLPLVRTEAEWKAAASLDGMPAPVEWNDSGVGCRIRIAEPGQRRLSIAFEPRTTQADGRQRLALTLPQITGAAATIAAPAALVDLQTSGTCEAHRQEPSRSKWHGELDGSGSFTASWPANAEASTAGARGGVDELRWLHLSPTGRTLDAIFVLRSGSVWPETIDIAVDPDWELLADNVLAADAATEVLADGRQLLRIHTKPATQDNRRLALRFRARDASALGRFRLPNIEVISLRVENRWFAVSCDLALECVPSSPAVAPATPPVDLTSGVGAPGDPPPQILANAARLGADWFLAVRPRAEQSTCHDELSLLCGKKQSRVDYLSNIAPQAADRFSWSLAVPEDLVVESITVTSGGETVPLDWVRASPNRLTAFFAREVSETFQLHLVGSVLAGQDGRLELPRIAPVGGSPATQTVALYRAADVLASWQFPTATRWTESDASQSPPFGTSPFGTDAHFVRAYSVDAPSADAVHILVETNEPVVRGDTLTTVSLTSGAWAATWTCDLRVERGELDVVRMQLPPNWTGPFEVVPSMMMRIDAPADIGASATISIQLPQSARPGDLLKLQLRSPLALADGEMPTAPQIALLARGQRRNFLLLPAALDGERADWTRRGIEPAELPPGLRPKAAGPDADPTYRMAESIHVALRPRATHATSANIQLAETAVRVGPGRGMIAVTRFVVSPEGLDQCVVELPAGERLVLATLDGHPALARAIDPLHWQVQLGPPNLPQSLDIVTRAAEPVEISTRSVELSRPVLRQSGRPIPIDLSLWTLYHAASDGTARVSGGALVTPGELATARLDRLVSVSQTATRSVIESPVVDGFSWFARWAADLKAAEEVASVLEHSSAGATEAIRVPQSADSYVSETVARSNAWIDQIADVFAATELTVSQREPVARAAFDPWQVTPLDAQGQVCFISDGDENRALVEWAPDRASVAQMRWLAVASFTVLACAALWLKRAPQAVQLAESWPEVAGFVLGLAAWAWLRPSVVGCLIAAVCGCLLLRRIARQIKITKARPPQPTELDSGGTGETLKSAQR